MKFFFSFLLAVITLSSCKTYEVSRFNPVTHAYGYQDSSFTMACEIKSEVIKSDKTNSFKIIITNDLDKSIYVTKDIKEQNSMNGYSLHCGSIDSSSSQTFLKFNKVNSGDSVVYDIPNDFAVFKKGPDFDIKDLVVYLSYFTEEKGNNARGANTKDVLVSNLPLIIKHEMKFNRKK